MIHFTILLANDSGIDSRKKAKNSQGIRIAILLELESTQPYSRLFESWSMRLRDRPRVSNDRRDQSQIPEPAALFAYACLHKGIKALKSACG